MGKAQDNQNPAGGQSNQSRESQLQILRNGFREMLEAPGHSGSYRALWGLLLTSHFPEWGHSFITLESRGSSHHTYTWPRLLAKKGLEKQVPGQRQPANQSVPNNWMNGWNSLSITKVHNFENVIITNLLSSIFKVAQEKFRWPPLKLRKESIHEEIVFPFFLIE